MDESKKEEPVRKNRTVYAVTGGFHPSAGIPVSEEFVTGGYGETSELQFAERGIDDQGRSVVTTQMKAPTGSSKSSTR